MASKFISSNIYPGLEIKQKRSQQTYESLIKTAFKLLKTKDLDSISIAELTNTAGYSVGTFYARFKNKNELLDALVAHHVKTRRDTHIKLFSSYKGRKLNDRLVEDVVKYISKNRGFYISSLTRSTHDPEFWKPMSALGNELATEYIEKLSTEINRKLTKKEELNVRFAFQVLFGTINNNIINRPGPIHVNQKIFTTELTRVFNLASGYDNIITKKRK